MICQVPGGEEPQYDPADMGILLRSREELLSLLESHRPVGESLAIALMYGYHAQSILDGAPIQEFDAEAALSEARGFAKAGDAAAILDFYRELEILTPQWRQRLQAPRYAQWERRHLTLLRYFAERYWLQAISDFELVGRVKLGILSCLAVKLLGGELAETAQLYSKEIENSPENVDAILEGAYTSPAFTDDKLLGLLLEVS